MQGATKPANPKLSEKGTQPYDALRRRGSINQFIMKKLIYIFVLLLIASFTAQAQTLTVQGSVSNGSMGGTPNQIVYIQINLSPAQTLFDSLFTDSLGNFSRNYPLSASQTSGFVTVVTYCNMLTITAIDSFFSPTFTTTHHLNCGGSTNPPPANSWLNGEVAPTALGDSILMRLYRVSLAGPIFDTSFYVVDTMNMGFMYYGFAVRNTGAYIISAYPINAPYLTTYYGNTTLQQQASFIQVNTPGTYNGLNIQLQTSPSTAPTIITGLVTGYTPSTTTIDSIQAILIEVQNGIWTPLDTMIALDTIGSGHFYFTTTSTGPYAVLTTLLNGNAANYAPTYHDNVTTWTASTPFTRNPSSNTIVLNNIMLQPASGTGNGSGSAGGGVFNGLPFTGSVGMAGIPVQLLDDNGNLLKVIHSRTDGSYNFINLPVGNYGMRVELFGIPSTTYMFTLSNSNPNLQINFTLGSNGIAASMEEPALTLVGTYPNPAKDWVRLQLKAKDGQTQTIQLRDVQGRLMLEKNVQLESGLQEIELSLNGMSQGVYLLEITGSQKSVSRLVIQ